MPIPDEVRKCVAFLAYKTPEGISLAGTVFFVGIQIPTPKYPELSFSYAVTAKHVIDAIKKNSIDGTVYLRMNFKDDGAKLLGSRLEDWRFHPSDNSVDVAAFPMAIAKEFDHLYYPTASFVTEETIKRQGIGIGDEIFLAGLFYRHYGRERNIPILRTGNIAAMPEEKIQSGSETMDAYLVEARSIGGLSGSPVFVNLSGVRLVQGNLNVGVAGFYLLGLMHGHWESDEADAMVVDSSKEQVNMGIAVVVPAQKILEVLNQSVFQRAPDDVINALRAQNAPTPDSGQGTS